MNEKLKEALQRLQGSNGTDRFFAYASYAQELQKVEPGRMATLLAAEDRVLELEAEIKAIAQFVEIADYDREFYRSRSSNNGDDYGDHFSSYALAEAIRAGKHKEKP